MRKFSRQFHQEISIDLTKPLVLAVSGGVDSMVMLDFLRRMKLNVVVVHFNHQKRVNSYEEAKLVQDYCDTYLLPYNYFKLTINSSDFQNRARMLRHRHLEEVASRLDTPYILTAHHLDDLLETILMNLTRGSNILGYAGMRQVNQMGQFIYVKPLLYYSKEDLIDYAKRHNVPYMEDESNYTTEYLRNRYRLTLVPIMKQENPNLLQVVKQYNLQLIAAYDAIRSQTLEYLNGNDNIDIPKFKLLSQAVQDDVIAYFLETNNVNLNYRLVEKIRDVLLSKKPNQTINLSNSLQLVKFYEKAEIKPASEFYFKKIKIKESDTKSKVHLDEFSYSSKKINTDSLQVEISYDQMEFPLWARNRLDGDVLEYDYGHKKLKKLLIDEKLPMEERQNLWIITDNQDRILWIPNYYINQNLGTGKSLYITYYGGKNNE
ncbi:MAG: tRNA lysidine(34) synthetase TilS [Acholeplasmataceae bacterium]|jgi:bifunctional protein TilS/HprT